MNDMTLMLLFMLGDSQKRIEVNLTIVEFCKKIPITTPMVSGI